MRIACYTLTRDRSDYTRRSFDSLKRLAGVPFQHYVLDNGSEDDTPEWLKQYYKPYWVKLLPSNVGIAVGANMCLDAIFADGDWDLVIKMDNDCEVQSGNMLLQFGEIFQAIKRWEGKFALSPRVDGIVTQPKRTHYRSFGGRRVGITGIIGGLFHVVPGEVYKEFRYNTGTPRGGYNDSYFCDWFRRKNGGEVGYVEGLVVSHMDTTEGQVKTHPHYIARKRVEMKADIGAGKGKRTA